MGTAGTANLCMPFVDALPVNRAAISMLNDPFGLETVCASDAIAARVDEMQIDLGEGPSWIALASQRPVIESDIQTGASDRWPLFTDAVRVTGVHAVFAFPLTVGSLRIGAVGLYCDEAGELSRREIGDASVLAGLAATEVLRRAMADLADPVGDGTDPVTVSRREIHQATGMVTAQLGITIQDALLVIRGHAYSTARPVRDIAHDVVTRRLDFSEVAT